MKKMQWKNSITIKLSWEKMVVWVFSLWMFIALILILTNAVDNVDYVSFKGDKGALVIIATWLFSTLTAFIDGKMRKLFGGMFYFILGIIIIIGTLISVPSVNTLLCWVVPCIFIALVGLWWILTGANVIKVKPKTKVVQP